MGCAPSKGGAVGPLSPSARVTPASSSTGKADAAGSGASSKETSSSPGGSSTGSPGDSTKLSKSKLAGPSRRTLEAAILQPTLKAITERYELGKVLGRGGFGEVRAATRRSDGKQVGVKIISKFKFQGEEEHQLMVTEVQLHHRVRGHPNVTELYEYSEDKGNFYMVLELATGGELMERIIQSNHFSEKEASRYFKQMASGLRHIHNRLVVHRDLKPENFLLASSAADAEIKITDFGLSCSISAPDSVMTDPCGSAYYIAPEVFTKKYTKAADVWSLGVNLYLLLSGNVPFGGTAETETEVYRAIQKQPLTFGPEWNQISAAARELVAGLLEKDPTKRYTLEQVLEHSWVAGGAAPDAPLDRSLLTSLLSFNARNKFKKAALKQVASMLTSADVANLRAAFHKIDADNTGYITYNEMNNALRGMGVSDDATTGTLIKNLDADGDGRISYEEFLLAALERQMINHQNAIWWAFCEYDLDGDGRITVAELRQALQGESEEAVQKYIGEYDRNGDGVIDYEEFMRMLLPKDIKYKISAYR